MDIDGLVQNFRESQKEREEEVEEEEDENDVVLEEEKCNVKTYKDTFKSLKELQEFVVQQNVCGKSGSKESKLHAENPAWLLEKIKKKREL